MEVQSLAGGPGLVGSDLPQTLALLQPEKFRSLPSWMHSTVSWAIIRCTVRPWWGTRMASRVTPESSCPFGNGRMQAAGEADLR